MSKRRKRNIIICTLCGVLLLMVVGYAAFATQLNINGTASITSNWDIKITDIKQNTKEGDVTDEKSQVVDDLTASFNVNLVSPGDYITYDVTIENKGTIDATLEKIKVTGSNNPAIEVSYSGIKEGEDLNQSTSKILTVRVRYSSSVTSQPKSTDAHFSITLDYVQTGKSMPPSLTDNVKRIGDSIVQIVTEGEGLQKDEYEDGRYI